MCFKNILIVSYLIIGIEYILILLWFLSMATSFRTCHLYIFFISAIMLGINQPGLFLLVKQWSVFRRVLLGGVWAGDAVLCELWVLTVRMRATARRMGWRVASPRVRGGEGERPARREGAGSGRGGRRRRAEQELHATHTRTTGMRGDGGGCAAGGAGVTARGSGSGGGSTFDAGRPAARAPAAARALRPAPRSAKATLRRTPAALRTHRASNIDLYHLHPLHWPSRRTPVTY